VWGRTTNPLNVSEESQNQREKENINGEKLPLSSANL